MKKEAHCLECGKPIYGRPDKKFCSTGCKNEYHYQHNAVNIRHKNWVHSTLGRNYRILNELLEQGKKHHSLVDLQMRGFTPQLMTSHLGSRGSISRYACYDIIYTQSRTEVYGVQKA